VDIDDGSCGVICHSVFSDFLAGEQADDSGFYGGGRRGDKEGKLVEPEGDSGLDICGNSGGGDAGQSARRNGFDFPGVLYVAVELKSSCVQVLVFAGGNGLCST